MFKGYRVSVGGDEKVLKWLVVMLHNNVRVLNVTELYVQNNTFHITGLLPQIKKPHVTLTSNGYIILNELVIILNGLQNSQFLIT